MSKKIVSIFDKKDDDHERDHGQAFYAGGSEHSGQQILGPGRDSIVENLLNAARQRAEDRETPPESTLPITLWRNGFTVGADGELRDYASNQQFIECLRRGEVPPELSSRVQGGLIDVKLDNKSFQDYEPERRAQVFTGEGHRLGAPTPSVVERNNEQTSDNSAPASGPSQAGPSLDEIRLKRLARFSQKPPQQ